MFSEPGDVSADLLKILWYARLHPALNTKWDTIFNFMNVSLYGLFMILAIKGILVSYNNDIFFMSECFQTCIIMIHAIGKLLTLQLHKNDLLILLDKKANFWKIADFDRDPKVEAVKIFKTVNFIIRFYYSMALVTLSFFDLQPLITGYLPIVCYVPDGWFNYLTLLIWYLSGISILLVPGTDGFFYALVSAVIVQFKLLAYKFNNISDFIGDSEQHLWKELKILVEYHNALLSYCKDLNRIFRSIFLLQFGMSIATCALSIFIFTQPGPWTNRIKLLLYFLAILFGTGFYCIPLEIAANTAQAIDNAVYNSIWYKINFMGVKRCLSVIIGKAQEPIIFSGYGLININLRTYVLICKTSFSFYTYLNSAQKLANK